MSEKRRLLTKILQYCEDWGVNKESELGELLKEAYQHIEKIEEKTAARKCPFRKITTNEEYVIDKDGNMGPQKTVEEFGPCYEDNCPYYDTIFCEEGEFRCRRVAIEGSKAK